MARRRGPTFGSIARKLGWAAAVLLVLGPQTALALDCVGGANDGNACTTHSECPGGYCAAEATPTATPTATATATPTATRTATPTPTATPTLSPTPTLTRTPKRALTATPTATVTPTPTATQTPRVGSGGWRSYNYSVNPGEIAAITRGSVDVTITGLAVTDLVVVEPPADLNTGLAYAGHLVTANTVTLYIVNVTAGAINDGATNWRISRRRP